MLKPKIKVTKYECKSCNYPKVFGCQLHTRQDLYDKCPCKDCIIKVLCTDQCDKRGNLVMQYMQREYKEHIKGK